MIVAKILNVSETAQPKYAAAIDAQRRNIENAGLWSKSTKEEAHRFVDAVKLAYPHSRVFFNYRLKFIAVKVENPDRRDMVSREAVAVDTYAEFQGYDRVLTKNALIFRIRK